MERKLSSKDLVLDITSMHNFAMQLLGKGKEYEVLLNYLMSKDFYSDADLAIPSMKELQNLLGLDYSKLRNQLTSIYDDLLNYEESGIDYSVKKVEYIFSMNYFDRYATFKLDQLPVMPRVGENIEISFCRAKLGTDFFYVNSIHHYVTAEKQIIGINLRCGLYNQYLHWRKDEAILKREISDEDYHAHMDHTIKEKLKLKVW